MAGVKERDRINNWRTIFACGHSAIRSVKNAKRFLSLGTHVFNAYYSQLNKHDLGWPAEVICDPDMWASFIPCPCHFRDKNMFMLAVGKKGVKKSILITDSTPAAGLPDGEYTFGDQDVCVGKGAAWLVNKGKDDKEEKRLAGSTLTMDKAVANSVNIFGFSLPEAVRMATLNPAQLLGQDQEMGTLEQGRKANIILFGFKGKERERKLVVYKNILEGEMVYEDPCF